jgi:hypothetical protein
LFAHEEGGTDASRSKHRTLDPECRTITSNSGHLDRLARKEHNMITVIQLGLVTAICAFGGAGPALAAHSGPASSIDPGGFGGFDIWTATRANVHQPRSTPVNLGPNVTSEFAEMRPSFSRNGKRLHFGSARPDGEGSSDIYLSTR